ncbi:homeodomain-like protein [Tanacetum coccineum]
MKGTDHLYQTCSHFSSNEAELVTNGSWSWPQSWLLKAPDLGLIPDPILDLSRDDVRQWRDNNGSFLVFYVAKAWETLRPRGTQVPWVRIVWVSHAIPRNAFHLWLVMRSGLKTQDRMRQWDVGVGTDLNLLRCALCDSQPDSHAHLFFECPFSSKVWLYVRELVGMELIPPIMHDIISYLQPINKKRTALSILGKLILAASSYFIWLERNNRVFKQVKKSPEDIRDIIMVAVRLKLLTFCFKDTSMVNQLLARWKMPKSFRLYVEFSLSIGLDDCGMSQSW